ncbi:hypothetical protein [Methylobacterium durans]|nr:hypothetical protein [Methylobacterium durans]
MEIKIKPTIKGGVPPVESGVRGKTVPTGGRTMDRASVPRDYQII